jgi:hypothetical protein
MADVGPPSSSFSKEARLVNDEARMDALKREWTDQYVLVNADRPELRRFAGIVGRVTTVNWNGKALVDFQDGGWYDITASPEYLIRADATAAARFNGKANSAQPFPARQS